MDKSATSSYRITMRLEIDDASGPFSQITAAIAERGGRLDGVDLEDISAPRCFEIEERLKPGCP